MPPLVMYVYIALRRDYSARLFFSATGMVRSMCEI
jgi:hypothetical protein